MNKTVNRFGLKDKASSYHRTFSEKLFTKIKVLLNPGITIGANVTIVKGISIGDGAIIGANAVVTRNIPPYEIWGGVPAKFLKNRD